MALIRLDRLLSNRGYCTRKEARAWLRQGRVELEGSEPGEVRVDSKVDPGRVRVDGEPLDPGSLLLLMNKPAGLTCSHRDQGGLVYELLPERFLQRSPALSSVGRLDRDTTGLLLFTDDGALLHRLTSPRYKVPKVYEVVLAEPLRGDEAARFASGELVLEGEREPLQPARLEALGPREARLVITEGRYHQVKRMFEAVGNAVLSLHRSRFGSLEVGDLAPGSWRALGSEEEEGIRSWTGGLPGSDPGS